MAGDGACRIHGHDGVAVHIAVAEFMEVSPNDKAPSFAGALPRPQRRVYSGNLSATYRLDDGSIMFSAG